MIKLIVFDFDGTLVNSKKILLSIIKKNIESKGYKLNKDFMHRFGDAPLKKSFKWINIKKKDVRYLDKTIHEEFFANVGKIKIARNVQSLRNIKQEKVIVTNSISNFVKTILKKQKINFFKHIYGPDQFKNKIIELKHLMRKRKIKSNQVIYVGDRPIDVKVARKSNCISVVISNESSWSPLKELIAAKPDFLIRNLSELKGVVDALS